MSVMLGLLDAVPASVKGGIALLLLGGMGVFGAESRYMTVDDFTKSYILDLKAEIREIQKELRFEELTEREKLWLEEQLEALLDELCYEVPDDPYCEDR